MKKLITLLTCCALVSCQNSGNKKTGIGDRDATEIVLPQQDPVPVGRFIEEIRVLPLESDEEQMIGVIDHVLFAKNRIIVSDMRASKSVHIFDSCGKKRAVISRLGRGPEEYLLPFYATLTPDGERIAIYDNGGSKVLFFDLDGKFLEKKNVDFLFTSFEYVDEDHIVCIPYAAADSPALKKAKADDGLVVFTDGDFNIQAGALHNTYGSKAQFPTMPSLKKINGKVFVTPVFCDTVYEATPTPALLPRYRLDLSAIADRPRVDAETTYEDYSEIMDRSTLFSGIFTENDSFAMFLLCENRIVKERIFDKNTKEVFALTRDYQVNKPAEVGWFDVYLLSSKYVSDNRFVAVVPAYQILMGSPNIAEKYPQLTGLTENSNPVLVFYKLKNPGQLKN